MRADKKTPALSERAHLDATRPTNNRGSWERSRMIITHTLANRSAGMTTATTRRNFERGSKRWTGVFRLENLNPSRVLRDSSLQSSKLIFQQDSCSVNINNISRQTKPRQCTEKPAHLWLRERGPTYDLIV